MVIAKLKRVRNSFLDVSRLPSEILGDIFSRNAGFRGGFGGLGKKSHNFLLVCHRWFEIASHAPEVWSFWGNTFQDWKKFYLRYPTGPVDLVLNGDTLEADDFYDVHEIQDALRDRAKRDKLRRIHLRSGRAALLGAILSFLTSHRETRFSSVETILIINEGSHPTQLDVSDFFARHRFPKLRYLELIGCQTLSWEVTMGQTSALSTLYICYPDVSQLPTTSSQPFSMIACNPLLRELRLSRFALPREAKESSLRAVLPHLDMLELTGSPRHVFWLLQRLDHPKNMNYLKLDLESCKPDDVPGNIGPYLCDYLQHHQRSRSGLAIVILSSRDSVTIFIGNVSGMDSSRQTRVETLVELSFRPRSVSQTIGEVTLSLVARSLEEKIWYLGVHGGLVNVTEISTRLPHIRVLHFNRGDLHRIFSNPAHGMDMVMFPALRRITLDSITVADGDSWSSLTTFLHRHTSSGNRLDLLETIGIHPTRPEVEEDIKRAVREYKKIRPPWRTPMDGS